MSVQPTSLYPGVRALEGGSDFQQMVSRVLSVLRQRRWLFIVPLLTGVIVGLAVSLFLPRRYVLNAMFERRDDVVITNLLTNNSPYSFETIRRSLNIDMVGYNALSEAADQLGLTQDLPHDAAGELTPEGRSKRQAMLMSLSRDVDVNLAEKSTFLDLIAVKYTGSQPELGVKLVTQLKDNYIRRTRTRIADILRKSHDFFSQEASKRREKAASMEAELLQMSVQHPGVDPSDPGVLDQRLLNHNLQLEELARRRSEHQAKLQACEEYLAQLEGRRPNTPTQPLAPATISNPERVRIVGQIEKVKSELVDAKTLRKMTDEHPAVVALKQKQQELESALASIPERLPLELKADAPEPGLTPLDTEKKRLSAEIKSLQALLAQVQKEEVRHATDKKRLEDEKGKLFERRQAYLAKQQELSVAKSDLKIWQTHVETIARVLAAEYESRGIQFATVEDARRPAKPVSPTLAGVFLISFALGLGLGIASVFLREVLDRSLRTAQRVRDSLSMPVLEVLGEIRVNRGAAYRLQRCLMPALATVQVVAICAVGVLAYLSIEQPLVYERILGQIRHVIPV